MARFPQDLADRVEHYAGRKRQTVSEVLRDGVLVLLQDDDPYRQYTSDRNATLDIVSDVKGAEEEEEPTDAQPVIVSDMKEALPDTVSDRKGEMAPAAGMAAASTDILSDVKEAQPDIASDTKKARQRKRTKRDHVSDTHAESEKASDRQEDTSSLVPDSTAAPSSLASDTHEEASHGPAQPIPLPEPEPADRDSLEWRRWAVLEQVRTAQAPATPGDIARQIGATSGLVRHDLEHWRQQGRVQRDAQGGYVCSSGVLARVSDTLAHDLRPRVGPPARQTPTAPGQTSYQTAQSSPRADGRQPRGAAKKNVRQERGKK